MPRARSALTAAALLAAALAAAGCGERARPPGRVLLIGIDGATLRVAGPLMAEGRLPHLRAIAEQGASGPLRSLQPLLSPRIWTTIATGKVPEKHGIEGWATPPRDGESRLYFSFDRRARALWVIASEAGRSVGVVNWLATYPPEAVRGVVISDHALPGAARGKRFMRNIFAREADPEAPRPRGPSPALQGPATFPAEWGARVESAVADVRPVVAVADPFAGRALPHWVKPEQLARFRAQDESLARLALDVEAQVQPDVMLVLLQGIDRVSHWLWGTLEPAEDYPKALRPSPAERAGGADALRAYYEFSDALIGALLARYRRDDLVVVVSDHGFEGGVGWNKRLTGIHNSRRSEDGVFFARGRGIPPGTKAEGLSVTDVTPTVLAWLGLPVAEDMDGRPAPFLAASPATIASYDEEPARPAAGAPSGAEAAILEQLRELGYVE